MPGQTASLCWTLHWFDFQPAETRSGPYSQEMLGVNVTAAYLSPWLGCHRRTRWDCKRESISKKTQAEGKGHVARVTIVHKLLVCFELESIRLSSLYNNMVMKNITLKYVSLIHFQRYGMVMVW